MESKFTGSLLEQIGTHIVFMLMVTFTLGIATPWAVCYLINWYAKNVTIDGRRIKFGGNGGDLFVQYIKWFLLTIVTLGIYSFWLCINMTKWVVKNCHLE